MKAPTTKVTTAASEMTETTTTPSDRLSPLEQVVAASSSTSNPLLTSPVIPGFVAKLFRMLQEDSSTALIHWTQSGASFLVASPEDFSRKVLPKYFKHNNFSSFVRQLNMYGFHKVSPAGLSPTMSSIADPSSSSSHWEFAHPHFKRGHPELLPEVKRKSNARDEGGISADGPTTGPSSSTHPRGRQLDSATVTAMQKELSAIREQQQAIKTDIQAIQRNSQLLWTETIASRERHKQQQQVIDKILQFLASVFSGDNKLNAAGSSSAIPNITTSPAATAPLHDNDNETAVTKRPRLMMIEDSMDADLRRQVIELMKEGRKATPPAADTRHRVFDLSETARGLSADIDGFEDTLDGFDDPVLPDPPLPGSDSIDFDISRYIEESPSFD